MSLALLDEVTEEPTLVSVSLYTESEAPTVEFPLTKSDAIHEAHEQLRMGETEAAGYWLLMAAGMTAEPELAEKPVVTVHIGDQQEDISEYFHAVCEGYAARDRGLK